MAYFNQKIPFPFFSKRHSFRVSILVLFLSLFALAFICVMSFTYSKNYKSIFNFSKTVAMETTAVIQAKFETLALASERVTRICADFFPSIGTLDLNNPVLRAFFLNIIKNDPNFSSIYAAFPSGDSLVVFRTEMSHRHFLKNPSESLPSGVEFSVLYNTANPSTNAWHYLDHQFKELATETLSPSSIHPQSRPWYVGAEKTQHLFWTQFYTFLPSLEKGITISNPLYIEGKLACVIGADLSFKLLSQFLKNQNVGKSGKAFILSDKGEILVPDESSSDSIPSSLVLTAYSQFRTDPKTVDFLFNYKGTKYLSFITKIPFVFGSDWMIIAIAPLDDFLGDIIKTQNQVLLFILFIVLISTLIVIYFSKKIATPIMVLASEIDKIKTLNLSSTVRVASNIKEIFLLDNAIASMRRVVESFAKYIPKEIVKKLLQTNHDISVGGEKKEITIFFSDIANFTTIAESEPIDNLFPLLTQYFDAMSKIILNKQGTIDKFIGDGIMAFWGAPLDQSQHTQSACDAALQCHAMLQSFNAKRKAEGKPEFPTRFGIHTGTVIVGNIGTQDRLNYTVIGDAVNATARLQEVDKVYHTSLIISEEVYLKLGKEYIARPLDVVSVKGKMHKLKIYELKGKINSLEAICPSIEEIKLCEQFKKAYEAMENNQIQEATTLFKGIAENYPDDFPTQIYLKRLQTLATSD